MQRLMPVLLSLVLCLSSGCRKEISVCPEPLEIPGTIILRLEQDGTAEEWTWLDRFDRQQQKLDLKP